MLELFGGVDRGLYHAGRNVIDMLLVEHSSTRELMQKNGIVRILLVDDNEPFRRSISSMLRERANLQVIGESDDGLQAVRNAETLQPDLILLDIGLPGINGIEAARQISKVAGRARIIFLTQESSPEVVQEAFALGAWAYIIKAHAGSELLPAMDAVSRGKRFVNEHNNDD